MADKGPVQSRRPLKATVAYLAIATLCALLLLADLILVEAGVLTRQDRDIELAAHLAFRTVTFPFFQDVSTVEGGIGRVIAVLIVGAILAFYRRWASVTLLAVAVLGSSLVNTILKNIVRRPRPHLFPSAEHAAGYSFPSGHAMDSITFFAILAFLVWHLTHRRALTSVALIVAAALTALAGLARVVLGVHYPSDVVGGYMGGTAWTALTISLLWRPLKQEQTGRLARALSRRHKSDPAA